MEPPYVAVKRVDRCKIERARLKTLYDNEAREGFRSDWGFPCLIEEKRMLFDTGGNVGTLLFKMRRLIADDLRSHRFLINPAKRCREHLRAMRCLFLDTA